MTDYENPDVHTDYLDQEAMIPMTEREPHEQWVPLTPLDQLVLNFGDRQVRIPIGEELTVGRRVDGNLDIEFDLTPFGAYSCGVSRIHARFTLEHGHLFLQDLGSTNGTCINESQLESGQKYRIFNGDKVDFASLKSTLHLAFENESPGRNVP